MGFSSFEEANEEIDQQLAGVEYYVFEKDNNNDLKSEEIDVQIKFKTNGAPVWAVQLLFGFKVDLKKYVNAQFKTIIPITLSALSD